MAPSPTCPRGHALEPNAVLCTVCWIRVEPVDPVVEAARRRRQRRIWIPLIGTSAVAVGVFLGGALGVIGHSPSTTVVMAEAAPVVVPAPDPVVETADLSTSPVPVPIPEPSTTAASPEAVMVVPMAATVAAWSTELCVPAETETVDVFTRAGKGDEWQSAEASFEVPGAANCSGTDVNATIALVSLPDDTTKVKVVSRDADGEKLQKDKVDA